jgi:hypothetical protein
LHHARKNGDKYLEPLDELIDIPYELRYFAGIIFRCKETTQRTV